MNTKFQTGFWICCKEFDACNNQDDWGWYEMVKSNVTAVTEESKASAWTIQESHSNPES